MRVKTYFVKYNIESGGIILDASSSKASTVEFLIVRGRVTHTQGKRLSERLKIVRLRLGRNLFVSEVEHEFDRMFRVCDCGFVTDRRDARKEWGDLCKSCFRKKQEEDRVRYQANKDYIRQVRKYKLHLNTLQGRIDSVPLSLIESNLRLELKKQGKTMKDLADGLCLRQSMINGLFKNRTIKKEYLLEMSEYLFIPVEKLLRRPRGFKIPYKDGVPKFWLDDNFVIRNYDDNLKERKL